MVTLTYRDDVDWSPRQVSNYLKCVREWARRKGIFIHYVWVLELTKRGRPHYHVLFWLPKGVSMPKADKQGWWKHGMTRSEWAYSPVGYLCKYTSKGIDFDSWGNCPAVVVYMGMVAIRLKCALHGHGVLLLLGFVN